MGRRDRDDPKVTAAQRAYLAALDNWLDRGAHEDSENLDRELRDVTLDDMLDEADPTLRARIAEREAARMDRRARP